MGRWSEQAQWVGPTGNQGGPMGQQRGMVLHVMQGSLVGSVNWGKNPASQVSFHFGTSKAGAVQQLVDTDVTAWTQSAGNGSWVSVENEDFSGNPLNAAQIEGCAQLYARGVREYGWLYQLANSPSGLGLGYHAMGGAAWGNHPDCPGQPIIDQRQAILDRAAQINGDIPSLPRQKEDDMAAFLAQDNTGIAVVWTGAGDVLWRNIAAIETVAAWNAAGVPGPFAVPSIATLGSPGGGSSGGASPAAIARAVNDDAAARLAD